MQLQTVKQNGKIKRTEVDSEKLALINIEKRYKAEEHDLKMKMLVEERDQKCKEHTINMKIVEEKLKRLQRQFVRIRIVELESFLKIQKLNLFL